MCAHRKNNLDRTLSSLKVDHEMKENTSNAKRLKIKMDQEVNDRVGSRFVKVTMEGYGIGRKVNLKAHDGYQSLSHALSKLFHNFLSGIYVNLSGHICIIHIYIHLYIYIYCYLVRLSMMRN